MFFSVYSEEDLKSYCNDNDWKIEDENIFLSNQEEHIKSKNISEKITFDSKLR